MVDGLIKYENNICTGVHVGTLIFFQGVRVPVLNASKLYEHVKTYMLLNLVPWQLPPTCSWVKDSPDNALSSFDASVSRAFNSDFKLSGISENTAGI